MNNSNFNQSNGFPLTTERLQELQTSFEIFNSFGDLAGNYTIISGCETIGTTVMNGRIFIDGELLDFKTAAVTPTSTVIIVETTVVRPFETGSDKQVYTIRYATFGTAETSWPWINFKKPIETKTIPVDLVSRLEILEKKNAVFQAGGGMLLWNKPANQIPTGWVEVIDWRGRMPIGFDSTQVEFNTMGKNGGNKSKQLHIDELPKVNLTIAAKKGGTFGGNQGLTVGDYGNGDYAPGEFVKPFGKDEPFSIMNPYRVVLFIEFIG